MQHSICLCLTVIAFLVLETPIAASAQVPTTRKQRSKAKPAAPRSAQPAPLPAPQPEVLTNESVIKMVAAGLTEEIVIAKIKSSASTFTMDTDGLIRLKSGNVPQAVIRAMLNWKAPGTAPAAAAPASTGTAAGNIVKDPGPLPPGPLAPAAPLDTVTARQGTHTFPLSDKPQAVMFVKSEAGTAREAVVDLVLGDVGIQLLTMGLQPMMGWNPYLGDTLNKAARIGKGVLLNRSGDTKGFEIETLTGSTADVTLKEGTAEFLIPVNRYIPSADMDPSTIEPVVLRMQPRENEQRRVLSGRKVTIKQTKKGRFDLKPTTNRVESDVEESTIPITVERMPENVIKITTNEALTRGEYVLVFRKKDASGKYTENVALKPATHQTSALAEGSPAAAAMPGMSPDMMGQMTPEQMQALQQMQQGQTQAQPARGGMFGFGRKAPAAAPAPAAQGGPASGAGFLAWDFRVLP